MKNDQQEMMRKLRTWSSWQGDPAGGTEAAGDGHMAAETMVGGGVVIASYKSSRKKYPTPFSHPLMSRRDLMAGLSTG